MDEADESEVLESKVILVMYDRLKSDKIIQMRRKQEAVYKRHGKLQTMLMQTVVVWKTKLE